MSEEVGEVRVFPECREHRETHHSELLPPWCNRCGWFRGDADDPPEKLGRGNGGWT